MASWTKRWEYVGDLSRGSQGKTKRVRRGGDPAAKTFVLKELLDPKKRVPRERMRREIKILQRLGGANVPRIEDFDDGEGGAFWYVMEEIAGHTLERSVENGLFTLDQALRLTELILDALEPCHADGVVHRDMKPRNLMLRDDDRTRPVLIDFGIATDPDETIDLTRVDEQMGNRFMLLPELFTPGANKRDPRSDLTYCCGLLLYVLTGVEIGMLDDGSGRAPHVRDLAQPGLKVIHPDRLVRLARVFDRGFRTRVDNRFQTISELRAAIAHVRHSTDASVEQAPRLADVQSLWVIHMLAGEPNSLYAHHRLMPPGGDLEHFFEGNRMPYSLAKLPPEVRGAANVLWAEVRAWPEVDRNIPKENAYKRAFDHVARVVSDAWAQDSIKTPGRVVWSRELERPNGRIRGGPDVEIPITSLSAASQAVVSILDGVVRTFAKEVYDEALRKQREWG